ncbi:MAG TPA: hypothetical protein VM165_00600 [Planctomycetaceae bacterium]|nr:hypothetical protein [Planctomycetaceae bacterium]
MNVLELPREFACRHRVPVLKTVDAAIFTRTYFTRCLQCDFCHDQCCSYGVDVDLLSLTQIQRHAPELEARTGISRTKWFKNEIYWDEDAPGGGYVRTRVKNGRCIFLNRSGRGCHIHAFCIEKGVDYHDLKSLTDCLFPLTWDGGMLCPSEEIEDGSLACVNTGPSLYRGSRPEILYYFGAECVAALDEMERLTSTSAIGHSALDIRGP